MQLRDVCLEYRSSRTGQTVPALGGVSFDIWPGEFVSIVGPSGCGKSTLLSVVDGLIPAKSGQVLLDGREVKQPGFDRSMVFQESSLLPWRTVLQNVTFGLECKDVPAAVAAKRAGDLLSLVGLDGFATLYPHELSGGMQQRVNLARALAVEPEILLMDEPFASLDAQTREIMQSELLDVWQRTRRTVLFVTHQIDEAIYLSDRVVVMSGRPGIVREVITVDLSRPRGLSVKATPEFLALIQRVWTLIQVDARRAAHAVA